MFIEKIETFSPAQNIQINAGPAGSKVCGGIAASTQIETELGWKTASDLNIGDRVYTYDGGLRRLENVTRTSGTDHAQMAIELPGGVFSNSQNVTLLLDQNLLFESPVVEEMFGKPAIMVAASELVGMAGAREINQDRGAEFIHLGFAQEEVIWANSGLLVHCSKSVGSDFFGSAKGFHAKMLLTELLEETTGYCLQSMVA